MRLALVFSTALVLAVGCLPTNNSNGNNNSGISAQNADPAQPGPDGRPTDPNDPGMDPGRPDEPGMPGDPGQPGDKCEALRYEIQVCFDSCQGTGGGMPGQPGDPGMPGQPGDPRDPATGTGGGAVDQGCIDMLCYPFFEATRACAEAGTSDCLAEREAEVACINDALAQCGGNPQPPPEQDCLQMYCGFAFAQLDACSGTMGSCEQERAVVEECLARAGEVCAPVPPQPDECVLRCQPLIDQLDVACNVQPPPPQPGDVCGLLFAALDACYQTPPPSCGCGDAGHGQDGTPPDEGNVHSGMGDPRDPANGGMGGEPGNPPGTGPGPGDPFARCATIETAIVELCNAPPQCGGR